LLSWRWLTGLTANEAVQQGQSARSGADGLVPPPIRRIRRRHRFE